MDVVFHYMFSLVVLYSLLLNPCYCINRKLFNVSKIQNEDPWQVAAATWYGEPNGGGSDGGACGYVDSVVKPPLSKMVSAGGHSLFNNGMGCGACYEVKCTENSACSGKSVTVMIADECPGCILKPVHFDLSGNAFGSMANPCQADNLLNVGQLLNVQYRRVSCFFGKSIAFTIDNGANPYYFATEVEYANGDGDLIDLELKQAHGSESDTWIPMKRSWGARWALISSVKLEPPFSIKLTESDKGSPKTIVADNVIPQNWQPGQVYRSVINF